MSKGYFTLKSIMNRINEVSCYLIVVSSILRHSTFLERHQDLRTIFFILYNVVSTFYWNHPSGFRVNLNHQQHRQQLQYNE